MVFQNFQEAARPKGLSDGGEAGLAGTRMNEMLGRIRLDQACLFVAAIPEQETLDEIRCSASHDYVNGAILPGILSRRRARLN